MPRLDGTGPMGMGPMSGRGFGYCSGYRYFRPFGRRGLGYRRGFDRLPYNYTDPQAYRISLEEERDILLRQKEFLEEELEAIKRELEEIE